ncbi:MAG: hypothetical protein JO341_03960 [Gammaproteobacteria bacterium]|nr:hypothetical protein [Gammaproteobacteria bacterium]
MVDELRVEGVFAVPLAQGRLHPCERLNQELEALFLARETDQHRNPTPSHTPQTETFESRFNLFRWPEPSVQALRRFMLESIFQVAAHASDCGPQTLARLTMHNHTWFHVSRYAGSFVAHNHPLASWSAVYCVRPGEPVAAHPESGLLKFFDPRAGANAYLDGANRQLKSAYALGVRSLRLEAGQLVVFPSYVFHEVTPFYGRDTRITVATNCWFV